MCFNLQGEGTGRSPSTFLQGMKTISHQTLEPADSSPSWGSCFLSPQGWGAAFWDGWAPDRADVTAFLCHTSTWSRATRAGAKGTPELHPSAG